MCFRPLPWKDQLVHLGNGPRNQRSVLDLTILKGQMPDHLAHHDQSCQPGEIKKGKCLTILRNHKILSFKCICQLAHTFWQPRRLHSSKWTKNYLFNVLGLHRYKLLRSEIYLHAGATMQQKGFNYATSNDTINIEIQELRYDTKGQ